MLREHEVSEFVSDVPFDVRVINEVGEDAFDLFFLDVNAADLEAFRDCFDAHLGRAADAVNEAD